MSSFHLPVLSYDTLATGDETQGINTPKAEAAQQLLQVGAVLPKAKAPRKVTKALAQPKENSHAERRAKAVYTAMERLLEETITDPQQLQSLVKPFSGGEYLQVAEERYLAGMCGSAACPNEKSLATGKGRLQHDGESGFCSPSCELAARRLASRLGSAEAAMDRFAAGTQKSKSPALKKVDEAASTYAAGADDNPIMLAQVKEKDPAVMQAEAQMQAALAERTAAALTAGSNPNAVEGYVPRSSPDIAAVNREDASISTSPTAATDTIDVNSTSQKQAPSSEQDLPASSCAEPHDAPVREADRMAHDRDKHRRDKDCTSTGKHGLDQPGVLQTEDTDPASGSASWSASLLSKDMVPTQSKRIFPGDGIEPDSLPATMHGTASSATEDHQQLAGSLPMSDVASSVAHAGTVTEQNVAENDVSTSADPALQPVLVFEVEDPEGPLDTPSEDIGQQFGRLQLKTAAELGLPAEQAAELAAAHSDVPQPSLEDDLKLWKQHVRIQQENDRGADSAPAVAPQVCERNIPDLSSTPELPEEDMASEGELQSDEDTALQWLSEPAPNFGRHLSGFGHVFTLLDSLVTERSLKLLQGKDHADSAEVPTRSSLQGQAVLEGAIERVLSNVLKAMRVPALRSAVEQHLHHLAATFSFPGAIPHLQGGDWHMLTVVLLKALSLEQLPALQEMFDSRAGAKNLCKYMTEVGYSIEEFWSLLDLLVE